MILLNNKTLKTLPLCLYESIQLSDDSLVTNIALDFASCIFGTRLSSRAVYFIQAGGSALSNTYFTYIKGVKFKQICQSFCKICSTTCHHM